ncbi:multicopper oxidase family protein [Mycolicibacterium novocastrense]|uniref:Multicopper oxidase n=1 Tax=Mycolicibacterium novocastrense TaxID=59813 RepID=A0AAW5SHB1_MYCNV|nr:multicopper oxidase family protein [Mycolicibacterium novocastrense]MCV7023426.1 multicopper oxidase family protein [Mycolicibacterium novocastrense]GAT12357.1 putative multicopper oxidase [Mycolicibacterium novocastrense]
MIDRREFFVLSAGATAAVVSGCSSRTPEPASADQATGPAFDITFTPAEADVDLGGVTVRTWAYRDQVPGPQIRIRKGDRMRAQLNNGLPAPTTIHWHGLAIPNAMDGVPVLTQPAVPAGQSFTYDFVVPDAGTYWYHSHEGTQLDRGLYGPLIIEDPADGADYDDELVVVLDDWVDGTGRTPDQVLADLNNAGMPAMPNLPDAGITPARPLGDDGGDVTYPYYLINGRVSADPQVVDHRGGQRIRLRIINAGSDTAFQVGVPGHPLRVIATDGFPVESTQTDSVILGMGERADAIVTLQTSAPIIAAAYRKDGYARLDMRVDNKAAAGNIDDYVAALRTRPPLDTATLAATPEVNLPERTDQQVIDMRLAGPVNGYTWTINGRRYDPPRDGYPVTRGQRVRIRYVNSSKMFHPMHLHGHTFQVMGTEGPRARKDTVLVAPLRTVDIDFDTDNPGRWITHCHNTYHLEAGMATFIEYA